LSTILSAVFVDKFAVGADIPLFGLVFFSTSKQTAHQMLVLDFGFKEWGFSTCEYLIVAGIY
jgi:hypothetical protein